MEFSFTQEQLMFRDVVKRFAAKEIVPRVRHHDLHAEFDFESFRKLGEFGLLGLHLPEEYGGSGSDVVTATLAGEALAEAGVDAGLTLALGAHTYLCADTIFRHGNEAQRETYVADLAAGRRIGCMALTEPNAGSDVASLTAWAEKKGDRYILNGTKIFITNGPIAEVVVVYARTRKDAGHAGISAFIVEKGTSGYSTGKKLDKLGVRSSQTSELFFEDCEIPEENLLGREGTGFLMAMQTVEWDRSALLGPVVGGMTFVLNKCIEYARERRQFGHPIGDFPAIRLKLANMKIFIEAARSLIYRIAWYKDQGRPLNHLEGAIAKLFVGDWSLGPANDAVILHGGYGFCHEYDVERFLRDSRLFPIGGGTSEIQKRIISKML